MKNLFYGIVSIGLWLSLVVSPAMVQPVSAAGETFPLALVFYGWHDSNTDQRIINAKPAILIDNTPGGFWHANCDSSKFQAQGIKVFSYIHASYGAYSLTDNYSFIDSIAAEGTYGVFLDEASPSATTYNTQICDYAHSKGLKVILNPGMSAINANMYSIADYVMTDEHYQGRNPTSVEATHLNQTIVIGFGNATAQAAAGYTNTAWAKGFGYTWHEELEYTSLPSWLEQYITLLQPAGVPIPNQAPVLSAIGSKNTTVGAAFQINLTATDPNGDSMTYSASGLPAGASFSNARFSWTPAQAGTFNVTFTVSDGTLTDLETVAITAINAIVVSPVPTQTPVGSGGGGFGSQLIGINIAGTSPWMDGNGRTLTVGQIHTPENTLSLTIPVGTSIWNAAGAAQSFLSATALEQPPQTPPGQTLIKAYEMGPNGVSFNPAIVLTISYDDREIPSGASEDSLRISWWNGSEWITLPGTIDKTANTISVPVIHFTSFALFALEPETPIVTEQSIDTQNLATNRGSILTQDSVNLNITPVYKLDNELSNIRVEYQFHDVVENTFQATLGLKVTLDNSLLEEPAYLISLDSQNGVIEYTPINGWQNGTYGFVVEMQYGGYNYSAVLTDLSHKLTLSGDVGTTGVVRWQLLAELIAGAVVLSLLIVLVGLRRFRSKN